MIEDVMEPLVLKWNSQGWGFKLMSGRVVNHAVWADNVWLFERDPANLQKMLSSLTAMLLESQLH